MHLTTPRFLTPFVQAVGFTISKSHFTITHYCVITILAGDWWRWGKTKRNRSSPVLTAIQTLVWVITPFHTEQASFLLQASWPRCTFMMCIPCLMSGLGIWNLFFDFGPLPAMPLSSTRPCRKLLVMWLGVLPASCAVLVLTACCDSYHAEGRCCVDFYEPGLWQSRISNSVRVTLERRLGAFPQCSY